MYTHRWYTVYRLTYTHFKTIRSALYTPPTSRTLLMIKAISDIEADYPAKISSKTPHVRFNTVVKDDSNVTIVS